MKLFVADNHKEGYVSEEDYHWCDDGDILMFGLFQTPNNRKKDEISMTAIKSRRFTTHILVKDINITREFLTELISESLKKAFHCEIDKEGKFSVTVGFEMHFELKHIIDELIDKASKFNDGDKVKCSGRKLMKAE